MRRLSALIGRTLRYEDEPLAQARAWRRELGAFEWEVDVWVGTYRAIAAGELARPSDVVLRLTGRAPCAFDVRERPQLLASLDRAGERKCGLYEFLTQRRKDAKKTCKKDDQSSKAD